MKTLRTGPFEITANAWPPLENKPVLIFIHGAALSKKFWNFQIAGLGQRVTALAIDLPGHGGSEGDAQNTIEGYARSILDFIDQASLGDYSLIPAGMSMGGAIVQKLLIDRPDLFTAGILINTGARLKVHPMIFDMVDKDFNAFIQSLPSASLSPKTDHKAFMPKIKNIVGNNTAQTALGDFTACNNFDVMVKIPSVTCPVLVCSAQDDVSTPSKYGIWLADNLPNANLVHIDNAGHFSAMEKPQTVNQAILDFLDHCTL